MITLKEFNALSKKEQLLVIFDLINQYIYEEDEELDYNINKDIIDFLQLPDNKDIMIEYGDLLEKSSEIYDYENEEYSIYNNVDLILELIDEKYN